MDKFSKSVKKGVINYVISNSLFLGKYEEYDGVITFLKMIWDLDDLPSTDRRYDNAEGDARQHLINNDDWDYEYLFFERFNLIDGDEIHFIKFTEAVVSPHVRVSQDEILSYAVNINSLLEESDYKLVVADYFEELPVFRIREKKDSIDLPLDIKKNNIKVITDLSDDSQLEYPNIELQYYRWDDYGYNTLTQMYYNESPDQSTKVGKVRIMKKGEKSTWNSFEKNFTELSSEYCSLGQSQDYYYRLKKCLKDDFFSFLLAIRDVAIFPKIYEQFEQDEIFNTSLLRYNDAEKIARTIRFQIEGIDFRDYFKFHYSYTPPYSENSIVLNFDFEYDSELNHRIYALIGKNGTGKTKLLASIAKNLSRKDSNNFTPRKPVYGKVFTLSYSFFDSFEIPSSDAAFNYVYCGLKKENNEWKTESDLKANFFSSVTLIEKKELIEEWHQILSEFLSQDLLDITFEKRPQLGLGPQSNTDLIFSVKKFETLRSRLSSGQSILLYQLTDILSKIRYESLILFDEPETHLHPNAIRSLMNTLFTLVNKFESFCIIATHSPIIVQEIPARNIFVIEREELSGYIRKLEKESFGENLTVITEEIFGNREIPKHFLKTIKNLVEKGLTEEGIISIIENDQLPISSNIRLYIKALSNS